MHLFLRTNIPNRHLDFKRPWTTSKCGHTQKEISQSVYDCCLDYSIKCSKPAALVASDSGNEITLLRKLLCTQNLFSMYWHVFSQNLFSSWERLMRADRSENIFKGWITFSKAATSALASSGRSTALAFTSTICSRVPRDEKAPGLQLGTSCPNQPRFTGHP